MLGLFRGFRDYYLSQYLHMITTFRDVYMVIEPPFLGDDARPFQGILEECHFGRVSRVKAQITLKP